jgi:uncharacterized membrane-anchored protein YitT (DUF2179 family)
MKKVTEKKETTEEIELLEKKKSKAFAVAVNYLLILVAGIIQAISLYVFILPNNFSPGGVTGIATMIFYLFPKINSGYLIIAFNIPLLILSIFFYKKDFIIKTAISISLTSVLLIVFPMINFYQYTTEQPIIAALAGGVISGIALGILFKLGGSNGGSEIIGGIMQKKLPAYNIAWFIFGIDLIVVLVSAFTIKGNKVDIILLSIIKMFCASKVCSALLEGFNSALKFEIVTKYPDILVKTIIKNLGRGVTKISARGGFTGDENAVLICVVRKRQIASLQKLLKQFPDTFAYTMNTKEVFGQGFTLPVSKSVKVDPAINADVEYSKAEEESLMLDAE